MLEVRFKERLSKDDQKQSDREEKLKMEFSAKITELVC